jgi:hypothetical protein
MWDVCTETGEIASAVLVPSTKTIHLSHAAIRLSKRETFNPSTMYSDRWPTKAGFWETVCGPSFVGRLGLFHYTQRIIKMRKRHIDHGIALNQLLDAVYFYNEEDLEKLLVALKNGSLSGGTKYSEQEIAKLKNTKYFRKRYARYLRKQIRPPNIMIQRLDDWFV